MATSNSHSSSQDAALTCVSWKRLNDAVFEVYRPASKCISMEIVFFHGFQTEDRNDAFYQTWMKGDDSGSWLDTWLVDCFPYARILSVSYDSRLTLSASTGRQDMYLTGENLAQSLVGLVGVGQSCPVVLVGYCLGGLVLKEICLWARKFSTLADNSVIFPHPYATFLSYVKGAFFFSTPNLGSHIHARKESGEGGRLLEHLEVLGEKSARINADFATLRHQHGWKTFGVGEANKTSMLKLLPYLGDITRSHLEREACPESLPFVDEASARADMDGFSSVPGVDHFTICKPDSQASTSFLLLSKFLGNICKRENAHEQYKERLQLTLQLPLRVIELDDREDRVIAMLQMGKAEPVRLALVGMDGIGKSTLAKQILIAIGHEFDYTCFVEMEDAPPNLKGRELERMVAENVYDQNGQKVRLNSGDSPWLHLRGKNVLFIVDDVYSEEQINPFLISNWCGECSRLIITSSRQNWAPDFIVFRVPLLFEAASKKLFEAHVEMSVLRLIPKEVVSQVVNECDGLPLTLEVIGRYLRDKKEVTVWSGSLEKLKTADSLDGGARGNKVWRKLRVSFSALGELEQKIFLDVATFDSYGLDRRRYDLNILKSAWGVGRDGLLELTDVGLVNLEQRSLLRVERCGRWQNTIHGHNSGLPIQVVRLHKQLQDMGRWISRPVEAHLRSCRSLWRLKDVEDMLIKCKGKKPETQVLSIAMEQDVSCAGSQCQDNSFPIQWSTIRRLEVLRLLRISDMHMVGYDLTLPGNLALLHMEKCTKGPERKRKWAWWPDSHAWPLREENVECLIALSVLILEKCNPVHLPENFHTLHRLKILKILSGRMPMKPLPKNFGLLPNLQHLSLDVSLKKLPNSILQLSSLQSLVLSGHFLEAWPIPTVANKYCHLTALTRLELVELPALSELPDSFGGMTSLKHLRVYKCTALKKLPEGFGALSQLETLKIEGCDKLETLCESFSSLRRLHELELKSLPAFRRLPTTFGYLPSLGLLALEECPTIKELPESFVDLQPISSLSFLMCGGLESLWPNRRHRGLGHGLRELDNIQVISCDNLQGLPESLEQLDSLSSLSVNYCGKFRYVPESLWQLTSLDNLDIVESKKLGINSESAEGVEGLPESVVQRSRLRFLTWSNCETLPTCIGQLTSLRSLSIDGGKRFVGFPDSVGALTALDSLEIANCQSFASLPEALGHLTSLTSLKIQNCQDLLSLPESIGHLSSLRFLRIDDCRNFVYLPESVGQLTTLSSLAIENCRNLESLPDSICDMTSLVNLLILDCKPFENMVGHLGQLTSLRTLFLSSWNDLSPLMASLQQLKAIRKLFVKCMICENTLLSHEVLRPKILTQVEDCCGCIHMMNFLKSVEKYLLCKHPLEITVQESWHFSSMDGIYLPLPGVQKLLVVALRIHLECGRRMIGREHPRVVKLLNFSNCNNSIEPKL